MTGRSQTRRYPDALGAAEACALRVLELMEAAIAERGAASLAISGGSSPKPMFQSFARSSFPWERVHLFWVDERAVPPTDEQSNFKLAADTWLTSVSAQAKFPSANIHRIQAELAPDEASRLYRDEIRDYFKLADGEPPRFDVIHRGMGPDGHTASLFPGSPLVEAWAGDWTGDRTGIAAAVWAAAIWVEKMHQWRITLLPAVLEAARHTLMLVTGADKTQMLRTVLEGPYDPQQTPAQIASRNDSAEWFLDEAAAAGL
jgi:6-phosphogluconolactonase